MIKILFWLFIVFILIGGQVWAEVYTSMFIPKIKKAMIIMIPIGIISIPVYYIALKNLLILVENVWQVGIYMAIPITLGVWIGTYLGSNGTLPNMNQYIAMAINVFAVYISNK